jgi:crossover junction endodeoxyribonuclease RusA
MSGNSISVSWPSRVLSPNVTAHWRRKSAARKAAKQEAFTLAKQAKIAGIPGPIKVKLDAYPMYERKRDHDNLLASLKGHLDGLALAMDVDDSQFRPEITIHPAGGLGFVQITVEAA